VGAVGATTGLGLREDLRDGEGEEEAKVGFGNFEFEVRHSLHSGGKTGGSKRSSKDLGSVRETVLKVLEERCTSGGRPPRSWRPTHEVTVGCVLWCSSPRPPDRRCLLQKQVLLREAAAPPS